jgi:hypothetical protein
MLILSQVVTYTDEWANRGTDFNRHSAGIQWKRVRITGGQIHRVESLVLHNDEYSASNSDPASPSETRLSQVTERCMDPRDGLPKIVR